MSDGTKRLLSELIVLYEVEPTLSEVITEGRTDAAVIHWFLHRHGSDASVYCISDRLEVPTAEVRRRGQNSGCKGNVIAAALALQESSPDAAQRITFIYDPDDDVIANRQVPRAACLAGTDFASMELYCFATEPIDKLLKVTLRAQGDVEASVVIDVISKPLVELACARLILQSLPRPVAMISTIERRLRVAGDTLIADIRSLITDSVGRAGGAQRLGVDIESLVRQQVEMIPNFPTDIRMGIRGHDFTRVCCYYLKTRFPSIFRDDRGPYKTPAVFEGILLTCLEMRDLAAHELFRLILMRHGRSVTDSGEDTDRLVT